MSEELDHDAKPRILLYFSLYPPCSSIIVHAIVLRTWLLPRWRTMIDSFLALRSPRTQPLLNLPPHDETPVLSLLASISALARDLDSLATSNAASQRWPMVLSLPFRERTSDTTRVLICALPGLCQTNFTLIGMSMLQISPASSSPLDCREMFSDEFCRLWPERK